MSNTTTTVVLCQRFDLSKRVSFLFGTLLFCGQCHKDKVVGLINLNKHTNTVTQS